MYNNRMGGMGNMQNLMRQAQKMQEDMQNNLAKVEEELASTELTATAGGKMVEVVISGDKKVKGVHINPAVVDPDDVEMLEDLLTACINEAIAKADALEKEKKGSVTGNLGGLGGLF